MDIKNRALGRWLAEAVRYDEMANGLSDEAVERAALERAKNRMGDLSAKIVARAAYLPAAARLLRERARLSRLLRGLLIAGCVFAACIGAFTAHTAMAGSHDGRVNFYWLLLSLLGLHMGSFLLWLSLMLVRPRGEEGSLLGRLLLQLWRVAASRLSHSRYRGAALQASASRLTRGGAGRWLASCLAHILWCGFFIGAILALLVILSTQRYVFLWETTILSAETYIALTQVLGILPDLLGLTVPTSAQIEAAEWPGNGGGRIWSTLLLSSLILYGLLPRLFAGAFSLVFFYRAKNAAPLDLSKPGFARLVPLISPIVSQTAIVDPDDEDKASVGVPGELSANLPKLPQGQIYVMGWEMDTPKAGWPPTALQNHKRVSDLGLLDDRAALTKCLGRLKGDKTLAGIVVCVSLSQSPDRGVKAVFTDVLKAAGADKTVILLSNEQQAKARLGDKDVQTRLGDWIMMAHDAGVRMENVVKIDLNDLGDRDTRLFAMLFGGGAS